MESSSEVSSFLHAWDRSFGRKCMTLAQVLSNSNQELEDASRQLFGTHLTARSLGQQLRPIVDEYIDGLVLTKSHVSGHTGYYQVMTVAEYEVRYSKEFSDMTAEELDDCIANTRGTVKVEAIREKLKRSELTADLQLVGKAKVGDLLVSCGGTDMLRKFDPFRDKPDSIVGIYESDVVRGIKPAADPAKTIDTHNMYKFCSPCEDKTSRILNVQNGSFTNAMIWFFLVLSLLTSILGAFSVFNN